MLLDATPRGKPPGTLYVIEPDLDGLPLDVDAHAMDPVKVLAWPRRSAASCRARSSSGCEPQTRMRGDEEISRRSASPCAPRSTRGSALVEALLEDLTDKETEGGPP